MVHTEECLEYGWIWLDINHWIWLDICHQHSFLGWANNKNSAKCKISVDTWSLTIPDDEVMKIVNYNNKKITELHAIIGERLR